MVDVFSSGQFMPGLWRNCELYSYFLEFIYIYMCFRIRGKRGGATGNWSIYAYPVIKCAKCLRPFHENGVIPKQFFEDNAGHVLHSCISSLLSSDGEIVSYFLLPIQDVR